MKVRCELVLNKSGKVEFQQSVNGKRSEQTERNIRWPQDELTFSILRGSEDTPGNSVENKSFGLALSTWGAEIQMKFRRVASNQTPNLRLEFKNNVEEPYFKENPGVLAFAFYPGQGDVSGVIVFNDEYLWDKKAGRKTITNPDGSNSTVRIYSMIIVMIHELGHSLGLPHDEHGDTVDIMDPMYNPILYELSDWDIVRIRQLYGVRIFKHWGLYKRLKAALYFIKRRK